MAGLPRAILAHPLMRLGKPHRCDRALRAAACLPAQAKRPALAERYSAISGSGKSAAHAPVMRGRTE